MKVDRYTLYKDFATLEPYLSPDDLEAIREAAVKDKFGANGFYSLKVGEFLDAAFHNDFDAILECAGETVFDRYRAAAFGVWLNEFIAAAKRLTLRPTAKQVTSSIGCVSVSFEESVFFFMREYFGLHSFDDVRELTVADYLMAKKDDYNRRVVDRNMANSFKTNRK